MATEQATSGATGTGSAATEATLYLHPQTLARLGTLELRAKMIVEGVMSGMHRSPYHGFSVEFAQHRAYAPGDDLRHLDWKVYGRSDKLYLKQYEQETNLDLMLLVDGSGSMAYGTRHFASAAGTGASASPDGRLEWSKFDHATATAAALSYMALRQGDRVGLALFADSLHGGADRSGAQGQWRRIIDALSTHPVNQQTDFVRAVDQAMAKLTNRALIAIISDFYTDIDAIRTGLARLRHRRHDAMLFQVVDEAELSLNFDEIAPFEGFEGEGRLRIDPRAIRSAYIESFTKHREQIEKTARSFGFDYQLVRTHDWLGPPLASFMAARNAVLKRRKQA